ncbi:uncharacterized protein YchJ [Brassicibacter mesophilus]
MIIIGVQFSRMKSLKEYIDLYFDNNMNLVDVKFKTYTYADISEENKEKYAILGEEFAKTRTISYKKQTRKKKIGRNDPCPCGSGKKYKKCCVDVF